MYSMPDGSAYGTIHYPDGAVYDGGMRTVDDGEEMREGKGVLVSSDGSVYEGEWKDDCKHGRGCVSAPACRIPCRMHEDMFTLLTLLSLFTLLGRSIAAASSLSLEEVCLDDVVVGGQHMRSERQLCSHSPN